MKTRIVAASVHLLISAAVISIFLLLVYFVWYPYPFDQIHSVFDVVKLIIGVDLVLGPLLTLIIYDIGKPRSELIRDISLIVLVQLAALVWGAHITLKVRPMYASILDGTVYSVTRVDIGDDTLSGALALPSFWEKPKFVFIKPLDEKQAVQHVVDMVTKGGRDVMYQTQRYLPVLDFRAQVIEQAMDVAEFVAQGDNQQILNDFLQRHGGAAKDYILFPVENAQYRATIALRRDSLEVVGLLGKVRTEY